jgi:hypothetical protein
VRLGFELRALYVKTGFLPFEPHLQFILLWLFWRWWWGFLTNYLPRLALNCDPPDLSLSSSLDYRIEPLAPGFRVPFNIYWQWMMKTRYLRLMRKEMEDVAPFIQPFPDTCGNEHHCLNIFVYISDNFLRTNH